MTSNRTAVGTLAQVCSLVTDGTHDTPRPQASGYPLIKAKEIVGGRIDFVSCDHISAGDHERIVLRSRPEIRDTLFAHIGASLGEAAFVNTTRPFSIKNIALFKPNPEVILGRYLYYIVISPEFQGDVKAMRTGSAQPFLSLGQLRSHRIRYHSDLSHQAKIATVLSAYDNLIENNFRRINLLEEMAQRIYREWFVDFRYPGHEDVPLVDSGMGPIPVGWTWKELRELAAEARIGVDPKSVDPATPYVGLEHMPERSIAIADWGVANQAGSRKYEFKAGDVLFGKIRPNLHKVVVPPVEGICSTDAVVIRSRTARHAGLVLAVVSSDAFVEEAVQTSQGTKMPRANWNVLERYSIAVPPPSLIDSFGSFMGETVAVLHRLVMSNRNLRATRDLLLPRLISGGIDVTDLDIAIPDAVA
jgi:type I restriction enzyme, S subunit